MENPSCVQLEIYFVVDLYCDLCALDLWRNNMGYVPKSAKYPKMTTPTFIYSAIISYFDQIISDIYSEGWYIDWKEVNKQKSLV